MQRFKISPLSSGKTRKQDSSWFLMLFLFIQTIVSVIYLFRINDEIDSLKQRLSRLEINISNGEQKHV